MMELVCPAGTPAALRAAVDAGAHTVYCGFADETNARNFPGLNFSRAEMAEGVAYATARGARVLVAINTFPRAGEQALWHRAVADAHGAGAHAVILADPGLIAHAAEAHPDLRLHLSVQAAAANPDAINFYAEAFGIRRVVLPRVLTVEEITAINREIDIETEVFVFGGLCVMAEGRCSLSSWATGLSPNMNGVCSPASHVVYDEAAGQNEARLGGLLIHRTAKGAPVPYPTLCKGCFTAPATETGPAQTGHIFEDPVSLDATELIPRLQKAGVTALKIEGRQRSRAYVAQVVRAFRAAVEAAEAGAPMPTDLGALRYLPEGAPFQVGPTVNVYNEGTLEWLARKGATRICLPPELPLSSVAVLAQAGRAAGVAVEVWGHGRAPLAISGRCYHARLHDRAKDNCRFVCGDDPDGRDVETLDGQAFLTVNGVQTLGHAHTTAAGQIADLAGIGVSAIRLSPQAGDFGGVVQLYDQVVRQGTAPADALARLRAIMPEAAFADGFLAGAPGLRQAG